MLFLKRSSILDSIENFNITDAVEGNNILVGLEEDSNSLVELYVKSVSMFLRLAVLLLLVDGGWSCRTRWRARELGAYLDGKRVKALQSHVDVDRDGAAWRGHQ